MFYNDFAISVRAVKTGIQGDFLHPHSEFFFYV